MKRILKDIVLPVAVVVLGLWILDPNTDNPWRFWWGCVVLGAGRGWLHADRRKERGDGE